MVKDGQPNRSVLDERIDELYQRPLAEFTVSRNALAKTLAGPDAQLVKRLAKPTLIPWTINQVYWTARSVYDHLLESGAEVRRAQIAALEKPGTTAARMQKSREQVRKAVDAHQKAVAAAVHQALRAAAGADAHPPVDALTRMLESLSLAAVHPATPGRLTELVQPAGFEALTGVTPVFPLDAPAARPAGSPSPSSSAIDTLEGELSEEDKPPHTPRATAVSKREAAAAERERQKMLAAASQALAQARDLEHRARARADRAAAAVLDAERTLEKERQTLKDARSEVDEAERVRRDAEDALKAHAAD